MAEERERSRVARSIFAGVLDVDVLVVEEDVGDERRAEVVDPIQLEVGTRKLDPGRNIDGTELVLLLHDAFSHGGLPPASAPPAGTGIWVALAAYS